MAHLVRLGKGRGREEWKSWDIASQTLIDDSLYLARREESLHFIRVGEGRRV